MKGIDVLRDPLRNSGTAFTLEATRMREVAAAVATAVAKVAYAEKLARRPQPADMAAHIRAAMYRAAYTQLTAATCRRA
jgi:malic enzyme